MAAMGWRAKSSLPPNNAASKWYRPPQILHHGLELFRQVDAVLVPSRFTRDYYRQTLGLNSTALPSPLAWDRLRGSSRR